MGRERAIEVVEAAYDLTSDQRGWLARLVEAARPVFDHGTGVAGYTFELDARGRIQLTSEVVGSALSLGALAAIERSARALTAEEVAWSLEVPLQTASECHARHGSRLDDSRAFRHVGALGAADGLALRRVDADCRGFTLWAALGAPRRTTRPERLRWSCVAQHVIAAMRLRQCPGAGEEASRTRARARGALDRLRAAAVRTDRAQAGVDRAAAGDASELWRALAQGRLSLFDRFDLDGRRYLVAACNRPAALGVRALSDRERQIVARAARGASNKEIAYDLGLAASTVSSHLRSGMRALGVRDRAELAALLLRTGARSASDALAG